MEQANDLSFRRDVLKQAVPAIQPGDAQARLELCAEDIAFEFPFAPAGQPARSKASKRWASTSRPYPGRVAFGQLDLQTHQTVNPDVAVIEMTAPGRVKDTVEPYAVSYVVVLTVRDGLVKRYRDYWNPRSALRAPAGS